MAETKIKRIFKTMKMKKKRPIKKMLISTKKTQMGIPKEKRKL